MENDIIYQSINGICDKNIGIFNRSFSFGDGLFETCKVINGEIQYLNYHLQRIEKGANTLLLNLDLSELNIEIVKALNSIKNTSKDYICKITISRGESVRGYGFGKNIPTITTIFIQNTQFITNYHRSLNICNSGYCNNPKLAGIKHQNRLEQILAKNTGDDCIMLDENNNIISTTYANIFMIKDSIISTPNLKNCGIEGTRRAVILDNFEVNIATISAEKLLNADGAFITNSLIGLQNIDKIINTTLNNITSKNIIKDIKELLKL